MMIIVILLYSLFLAGFTTQNLRFLLLTFPCVIVIYAGSFFRIHDYVKSRYGILIFTSVTFVIIIQVLLSCRAFKPFYEDSRTVREISASLKSYPGKAIYTFNIDMGLRAYNIQNEIINIWEKDIKIFRPGSLILFNYVTSYRQWKGLNPMNNWKRVKEGHHLLLREHYSGGWNLYEIAD
jgi:hypothetical protein